MKYTVSWYGGWIRFKGFDLIFKRSERIAGCYLHRKYLSHQAANDYIATLIQSGRPFLACRLGAGETFAMRTYEFDHEKNKDKALKQICDCAGFFPERREAAEKFLKLMKETMTQADVCGTAIVPLDAYFMKKYLPKDAYSMDIAGGVPLSVINPWSALLRGKRVLVVHPFSSTIQKQYAKREHLFLDPDILPDFELITYKAIQTSAGEVDNRFSTWFEALEYMEEEIAKIDYDIALLGCGAYGMPLAAWIKAQGKQAIHLGGVLQLMFGIKGRRWDGTATEDEFYNEYWCYPDDSETPKSSSIVEGGCYWK